MGGLAVYASLFEPPVRRIDLHDIPTSHEPEGPALLNVLRMLDLPEAPTLAAERGQVVVYGGDEEILTRARETAAALDWPAKQVQYRPAVAPKKQAEQQ